MQGIPLMRCTSARMRSNRSEAQAPGVRRGAVRWLHEQGGLRLLLRRGAVGAPGGLARLGRHEPCAGALPPAAGPTPCDSKRCIRKRCLETVEALYVPQFCFQFVLRKAAKSQQVRLDIRELQAAW